MQIKEQERDATAPVGSPVRRSRRSRAVAAGLAVVAALAVAVGVAVNSEPGNEYPASPTEQITPFVSVPPPPYPAVGVDG